MSRQGWYLQLVQDDFVVWGYGPPKKHSVRHIDRAAIHIEVGSGRFITLPFELPEPLQSGAVPQEYTRLNSLAWRWDNDDNPGGMPWKLAASREQAIADADASLKHQNFETQRIFREALRDVRMFPVTSPTSTLAGSMGDPDLLAGADLLDGTGTPWPNKFIMANWEAMLTAAQGREDWMPVIRAEGKRGKLTLDPPLGCGHYGCVYATPSTDNTPLSADPAVVCKVSSDLSEVNFVRLAMQWPWPEGIVRYHAVLDVPGSHRKRSIAVIWREGADEVGKHLPGRDDHEKRIRKEFDDYHLAYLTAARYLREQAAKPAWAKHLKDAEGYSHWAYREVIWQDGINWDHEIYRRKPDDAFFFMKRLLIEQRIASAIRICQTSFQLMGSTNYAYHVGEALSFYLAKGVLLADVHLGNIGRVYREEHDAEGLQVITDPGHAIVFPNPRALGL